MLFVCFMNVPLLLLATLFPTPISGTDHGVVPFQLLLLFEQGWIFAEEWYEEEQESAPRAACSFHSNFSQKLLTKLTAFSAPGHGCPHFSALS